ncbi:MAG: glycosyltransferase [Acidobacteria bacterium]|nr:glycosyltransferase [Acidobacteriota bacterium]
MTRVSDMRICLVTAFPPSHQRINEYGLHLARTAQMRGARVIVLGDEYEPGEHELDEFTVRRCWRFNSILNPLRILRAVREMRPDVVWFNLVYSTFGDNPLAAFLGLCTPLLLRRSGFRTHVTLHHMLDAVELRHADIRFPGLYKKAGWLATRALLKADKVSVLLEQYRKRLFETYGATNVNVRRHGILGDLASPPDFSLRGDDFRVLVFGKFGRYKRLELVLRAWPQVRQAIPNAKLVIAGEDHPNRPGYMGHVAEQCRHDSTVEFLSYIPEDCLAEVFRRSHAVVLPYSSSGGPSGVAHLAAQYGLPLIGPDIPDLVQLVREEGLAIDYYRTEDSHDLADAIIELARDPHRARQMSEQNYNAILSMSMPRIVGQYLSDFREYLARPQPALNSPTELPTPELKEKAAA